MIDTNNWAKCIFNKEKEIRCLSIGFFFKKEKNKTCKKCKDNLSINNFEKIIKKLKDGSIVEYYKNICIQCVYIRSYELKKEKYFLLKNNEPEKYKEFLAKKQFCDRKYERLISKSLGNPYIAKIFNTNLKYVEKYPDLIKAKRAQLHLYRKLI